MNRFRSKIQSSVITFSSWSRKSYALFAVMGKMVRIGFLNIDLALVEVITIKKHLSLSVNQEDEEEDDRELLSVSEASLLERLMALPAVISDDIFYVTFYNILKKG